MSGVNTPASFEWQADAEEIAASLEAAGFRTSELYVKRGRTRRVSIEGERRSATLSDEIGWAVRAGSARGSLFFARSGPPIAGEPWPDPLPGILELPASGPGSLSQGSRAAPLATENEVDALVGRIEARLRSDLPAALLSHVVAEDGASAAEIHSSRGVRCRVTRRLGALRLFGIAPHRGERLSVELYLAAPRLTDLSPEEIGSRLAERLVLATGDTLAEARSGPAVLAPEAAAALLALCLGRLVGSEAEARGRRHRWGRVPITIVDDPYDPTGPIGQGADGEGVATRRVTLVDRGRFVQPLVSWREASAPELATGCSLRASWRELPRSGATALSIVPEGKETTRGLVDSLESGFVWTEALGAGRADEAADRFALPVAGYEISAGRDAVPIRRAVLRGSITSAIEAIDAVGSDRRFLPGRSFIGSPALRLAGVCVEPAPRR